MFRYRATGTCRRFHPRPLTERTRPERYPATAAGFCDWIEEMLIVPSGPLRGQHFRLMDWQRETLEDDPNRYIGALDGWLLDHGYTFRGRPE